MKAPIHHFSPNQTCGSIFCCRSEGGKSTVVFFAQGAYSVVGAPHFEVMMFTFPWPE